uniref:Exosome complex component MTR3, animal type n=1 Tax=Tetraselmis sp. GSL018 TaxID=582737 RepID=A0A061R6P0_9CHLO
MGEFRSVVFQPDVVKCTSGSVYAEFGNTKVTVAVYGPRASEKRSGFSEAGRLTCDIKYATYEPQAELQGFQEKQLSSLMQRALEPAVRLESFPKAQVDIYASVHESGGSDLAVVVTAASIALALAGISMFDLVACCRVSLAGTRVALDPSSAEEASEDASMLIAMMPQRNEVTQIHLQGTWVSKSLSAALDLGMGGCLQLDTAMRDCIASHSADNVAALANP